MYSNLGYTVYRQVLGYYSGENTEDAYGKPIFNSKILTLRNLPCSQFLF